MVRKENSISNALGIKKEIESAVRRTITQDRDNTIPKNLAIYEFTGYSQMSSDGKIQKNTGGIKDIKKGTIYSDVFIIGNGLGNLRGIYNSINVGDFVIVGWLGKTKPVILGTINDYVSQIQDNIPQIKEDEMILVSKEKGSYIILKSNGDIVLNTITGSKIRLSNTGHFKVFNKDNYGIECDVDGNLVLRGVTINSTNTAGDF
jgi:hypothetical protein